MSMNRNAFINREISWLAFNARVLQEAADPTVPLMEKVKFLAIFSSNLDEFFRVRVATMQRLMRFGKKTRQLAEEDPEYTLDHIQAIVARQQVRFEEIYQDILRQLQEQQIFIVDADQINDEQYRFIKEYFTAKVRPALIPLMTRQLPKFPTLNEQAIYLAVHLERQMPTQRSEYAMVEIPLDELSRFIPLPSRNKAQYVMLLEDVVRIGLPDIFAVFHLDVVEAYPVKITKDAELDIEDNVTKSFVETISTSVKLRNKGQPVRLTYDREMSDDFLTFLSKRLSLGKHDTLLPEGRYLNFKDFMKFPRFGSPELLYTPYPPLTHKDIHPRYSLLKTIRKQDILLHYPYQSFNYMIDLLREAAIDPKVTSIKMTLYRVAEQSKIVNVLRNAVKNGKAVTALFEFRARFDEEANIYWANQLIEEGVKVIYGIPELKVHAKLCLITRRERGSDVHYATVGTGNFNEDTARLYGDHTLITGDKRITTEVHAIFEFLQTNYKIKRYDHLIVSPFFMRDQWVGLIKREIKHAKTGKQAFIFLKLNSLVDHQMIDWLYKASQAGVQIWLIIRGICSLVPGIPELSDNIEAISIVDKYLEHSRILVFGNAGHPQYYLSSADWMTRNLDHRVEVACPIYDERIQRELQTYLDLQWRDNTKARLLNETQDNVYRQTPASPKVRAQDAIYQFLWRELEAGSETGASH